MKKELKKIATMALLMLLCLAMLAGCNNSPANNSTDEPDNTQEPANEPETSTETEEPNAVPKVMLVISFGTSYNDSRDITIGAIENALQAAYPDYEVRRAFTSQIIIDILEERENLDIDNVTEAMERLIADGVQEVIVQPTHVIRGFEFDDIVDEVSEYADKFASLKIGDPLLSSDEDYTRVIDAITSETATYNQDGTAIVFMGHGTHHDANATYGRLQDLLLEAGHSNYFVGTVEGAPLIEDVIPLIEGIGATKVVLLPLMVVAGDHANNDMAGDEEDSWKSILEAEGYEVEPILSGLGQYAAIHQIYIDHAAVTMAQ